MWKTPAFLGGIWPGKKGVILSLFLRQGDRYEYNLDEGFLGKYIKKLFIFFKIRYNLI